MYLCVHVVFYISEIYLETPNIFYYLTYVPPFRSFINHVVFYI